MNKNQYFPLFADNIMKELLLRHIIQGNDFVVICENSKKKNLGSRNLTEFSKIIR